MTDTTPTMPTHAPRAAGHVTVRLPGQLRDLTAGEDDVRVPAGTVGEVLDTLLDRYPGLRRHVRAEDGTLRDYVNVFVNEDDIRFLEGPASRVGAGDVVTIVPSIAGG